MDLKRAVTTVKSSLELIDSDIAKELGISVAQVLKIRNGYWKGLTAEFLVRASKYFQISIDELLNHKVVPAGYHCPKGHFYMHVSANENYPNYYVKKGDYLYVFPFVHEESKLNDLVLVERGEKLILEPYSGDEDQGQILFHVVGVVRTTTKISKADQNKIIIMTVPPQKQKTGQPTETPVQAEEA